jgi:hypothetical protein
MRKSLIAIVAVALVGGIAASAQAGMYTEIRDATSGQEPDLWQVLDSVAPDYSWQSTDYLNQGAGGRRVSDEWDMVWEGETIDVWLLTTYWGGNANPQDSLGQQLVYDDTALDGNAYTALSPGVDDWGDHAQIATAWPNQLIWADESSRPEAWSDPTLNSAFPGGITDRVTSYDVSGLDIYAWSGSSYELIVPAAASPSYILAFDPGSDRDYQDMLVLVQGASPVPEPATLSLLAFGTAAVIGRRRGSRA